MTEKNNDSFIQNNTLDTEKPSKDCSIGGNESIEKNFIDRIYGIKSPGNTKTQIKYVKWVPKTVSSHLN